MRDFRQNVLLIIIGGVICLVVFIFLTIPLRQEDNGKFASSSPRITPSPITRDSPDDHQITGPVQSLVVPSKQSEPEKKPFWPSPLPDRSAIDRQRMAGGLNRDLRERTRSLYGVVFQQLGLPLTAQEKVIDILTQPQKQLEQQAFEAAQSGNIPAPPSPEAARAQQVQQDQQLRSILGDAGFAQFDQYRVTIPDRLIVDAMDQQGGNLSESESQQLLQILTQARQQIMGQSGVTKNLGSMTPDQAMTAIQQQQALLQQTVRSRVQNILTPDQVTLLQGVLSQHTINPKVR